MWEGSSKSGVSFLTEGSMHYERAALLSGVKRDAGQESEEKIGE
jgi:hypothetical protein